MRYAIVKLKKATLERYAHEIIEEFEDEEAALERFSELDERSNAAVGYDLWVGNEGEWEPYG